MFMEKLCHRIPDAENKLELFLYCMKNIPIIGERSIKKLLQFFDLYKDKLVIQNVKETFLYIISVARKQSKDNQPKSSIDELENKICTECQKYETNDKENVIVTEKIEFEEKPNFFASPIMSSNTSRKLSQNTPLNETPQGVKKKKRLRHVTVEDDF